MKVNFKDYKSLCELGLTGESLSVECDYRRENSSFKDENHFFKNAENIRLICSDIESKKAESEALLKQLSRLNREHIALHRTLLLIKCLRKITNKQIVLDDNQLLSLLTPNFTVQFNDGISFRLLEGILFDTSRISADTADSITSYLNCLNKTDLPYIVKLPIIVVKLIEENIDLSTICVFISLYLNREYPILSDASLIIFLQSKDFKNIISTFRSKNNMGDLMIVVREFLKRLNHNYLDCCLSLRRKYGLLSSNKRLTNNLEFDNAYLSILVFMEEKPTAHEILDITTIPRRTVYRLMNNVKLLNE